MGCNTSQELKTKDVAAAAAAEEATNNEQCAADASAANVNATNESMENGEAAHANNGDAAAAAGAKDSHHQTNHSKSNSIITNGDANNVKLLAKDTEATSSSSSPKQNGAIATVNGEHDVVAAAIAGYKAEVARKCDKAEISELNDMELGEDEARADGQDEYVPDTDVYIPQHHHHGDHKVRRNPLRNLDLDFKFDVHSF